MQIYYEFIDVSAQLSSQHHVSFKFIYAHAHFCLNKFWAPLYMI